MKTPIQTLTLAFFLCGSYLKGQSLSPYLVTKDSLGGEHRFYMGREIATAVEENKQTRKEELLSRRNIPRRFFRQLNSSVAIFSRRAPLSKGMTVTEIGAGLWLPFRLRLLDKLHWKGFYIAEDIWPSYKPQMENSWSFRSRRREVPSKVVIGSENSL